MGLLEFFFNLSPSVMGSSSQSSKESRQLLLPVKGDKNGTAGPRHWEAEMAADTTREGWERGSTGLEKA